MPNETPPVGSPPVCGGGETTASHPGRSATDGKLAPGLILTTLGGASLAARGRGRGKTGAGLQTLFGPGKPVALLAYLASAPERRVPRDRISELLWSDRPPDVAQHDLRQTLWYIRRRVGTVVIANRTGELVLDRSVRCDRDAFLSALDGGQVERAVRLYRGDFLAGLGSSGSTGFDEWANLERYRLSRTFCNSGEEIARRAVRLGDFTRAIALAQRVRDAQQTDEACWRLYLETLLAGGERIRAATEADLLEWQLAMAGREPDPPTRELLRRARRRATPQDVQPMATAMARLVGRATEMGVLLRAWEKTRWRHGAHIEIVAPTGFGKTIFLKEAKTRLQALGACVVYLASNWTTREVPYVLASDVATELAELPGAAGVSAVTAAALVALNPTLSRRFPVAPDRAIGEEATRNRLFALLELLQAVSEERPIALLLDDVHWADNHSREVLDAVWDRVDRFATLIVTASRTASDRIPGAHTATVRLAPLAAKDMRMLLEGHGALPELQWARELPERLQTIAAGSPLAALDVLERAIDHGVLAVRGGIWTCAEPAELPARLEGLSGVRIQPIESHQRSILVIPFAPGDAAMDGYTDGLSEEVVAALTGIDSLRVISWASARKLKGSDREIAALASEINVRYVLRGRLAGSTEMVRVSLDLVHTASSTIVWSMQRVLGVGALSELAQQTAREVATALHVPLTPTQDRRLGRRAIPDGRAYECYLRAREVMSHDLTVERLHRARSLLRAGLRLGGENALLYATLGAVYSQYGLLMFENAGTLRRIQVCARKALELDRTSADAHFLTGLAWCRRGDIREGVRAMLRALAIDPYHRDALFWCIGWLGSLGKVEIGRPLAERLLDTDPLTTMNLCIPGWLEWLGGRFEAALPWYRRWLDLEPRNPASVHTIAMALVWNQRFDEARKVLTSLELLAPASPWIWYNNFFLHALRGERGEALAALTPELTAAARSFEITCWYLAGFCAMMDARDEALQWIAHAVQRGFINYPMLAEYDPFLTRLRGDARYEALLQRVKQEWEELEF